jgi:hypothetical protein
VKGSKISMSKQTTLGETQITPSPHDVVTVQLIEPADLPAFVQTTWPLQPSVIAPRNFGDTAAAVVKLFSAAHVELAQIKARRHL